MSHSSVTTSPSRTPPHFGFTSAPLDAGADFDSRRALPSPAPVSFAPPPCTFGDASAVSDPEALCNLIVNYIPPHMDKSQVQYMFSQYGPIASVRIIYDKESGESLGYGFVRYCFFFSATYAIECLNRFEIGGKRLKVAYANAAAAQQALAQMKEAHHCFTPEQLVAIQTVHYNQSVAAQMEA